MGRQLLNILLVLVLLRLDRATNGAVLSCYSCSTFEITDYAEASQSDVDSSLRFLAIVSAPECAENPNATAPQDCTDGQQCIMNDLNITIDYSGSAVQFSLLARECTSETAPQTTCYTHQDAEFNTVTASSQESVTSLGQTISHITGVSCLCPDDLCNNADVDVTTTTPLTSESIPLTTTDTTSTTAKNSAAETTTAENSATSTPGRTHHTAGTVNCLLLYTFLMTFCNYQ